MKIVAISLERAFLNRQFRPIRVLFVGKQLQTPDFPAVSISAAPLVKKLHFLETKVPAVIDRTNLTNTVIIYEQKKIEKSSAAQSDFFKDVQRSSEASQNTFISPITFGEPTELTKPPTLWLPGKPTTFRFPFHLPRPKHAIVKITKKSHKRRAVLFAGVTAMCLLLLTILLAPTVYYTLFPSDPVPIKTDTAGTPLGGNFASGSARVVSKIASPVYDPNLPEGNWLIIPKIGVNTEILESVSPDESLNKGVWRVPDFGTPTDLSKPMILAAHRYGWKAWWTNGNQYWRYHSFYLLPDLIPGDIVEVIADHRKYTYEIYAGEQAQTISDYNADLILYTCKFLDSPLRFFRYARLVDPNHPEAISSK